MVIEKFTIVAMVIGFDGSRAFTDFKTGTENYSYQVLKALSEIDKKNNYIVYLRPGVGKPHNFPHNFKFEILNFKYLWTQIGLGLQTFKDPLDILFVPAHTLPLLRKPGLKTLVTVHDLGSEYLPSMHQLKQRIYLSLMQNYQLKTATKIIAVSKATKLDLINKIGIEEKKIKVIYEGYDKEKFKVDAESNILKQYGIENQKYFLFLGTVQPRKNLKRLIEAIAMLKDEKLVVAGSKGWLSDEIYALPKKLGIEDRVKFLSYVPDKDLASLYKGAKAFLFPSLFEGFGLPILEAQACGCPVLTSNLSSMPEVAGDGAILVDPYSVDAIVKGIDRVKRKAESGKLIKKGFENIKRFSFEKCAQETLKVLEGLI